jgi:phosphate transport system permease protein
MKTEPDLYRSDLHTIKRKKINDVVRIVLFASTTLSVIILCVLIMNILNNAFGPVAVENTVDPASLTQEGVALEELDASQLISLLEEHLSSGLIRRYNSEEPLLERSRGDLLDLVNERIVKSAVLQSWSLGDAIFRGDEIDAYFLDNPETERQFRSWIHPKFLISSQSSVPEMAGVRTAILGSLWIILITFLFSFPIGIGAAIYLEEYAKKNRLQRIIQTNIYNLAGVPSIIYGLLGLAVFVRVLVPVTSGAAFGAADPSTANGRTILSAGLTLGLLILPIIIINTQESLRALPDSLRHSSFGLGATRWQTVWHHLLPNSFERILTGTIIALSRAIGETAPLVVVGASTFVSLDPSGPFSKFTTLPIQIYQWSARPQGEFRNIAAAAIIVLLVLLLSMNSFAIYLRNHYSKKRIL